MREIRASSTLTIYHDGQFWVGTIECVEDGRLSVCRIVFGAEPTTSEVGRLVCERWRYLRFTDDVVVGEVPKAASNPKRRQREAARELKAHGPSTKAQQALSKAREVAGRLRKEQERDRREQERTERFERKRQMRKQRHRGR